MIIDQSELIMSMEMSDFDTYLDVKTGKVYNFSSDMDDEFLAMYEFDEEYIQNHPERFKQLDEIPYSDKIYRIKDFVKSTDISTKDKENIASILDGSSILRKFKNYLSPMLLEKRYAFESDQIDKYLDDYLSDLGVVDFEFK